MPCGLSCSMAEAAAARPHLEQGLRLYNPERHRSHAGSYGGHDPGVCCRMVTASSLWLLGYPDQAVVSSQSSLELAQQLDHPFSLTIALVFAAMLHHCRREAPLTQARTEDRHNVGRGTKLSATTGASKILAWLGPRRMWTRGGGHRTDPSSGLRPIDRSDQRPII